MKDKIEWRKGILFNCLEINGKLYIRYEVVVVFGLILLTVLFLILGSV